MRDWKVSWARKDLHDHPEVEAHISSILYRPFDMRFTYYTGKSRGFICMPRGDVMRHVRTRPNLGLISVRQVAEGVFNHVFVSTRISDFRTTLSNKGGSYVFPLYLYPSETSADFGNERTQNIDKDFVELFSSSIGLEFVSDGMGDLEVEFGPEDVFHYIYAVLHSPEYRSRYADFLKSDFPHMPLTSNRKLFAGLVTLGRHLASLHLMKAEVESNVAFPLRGPNKVDRVHYVPPTKGDRGQLWINRNQYFEGVTPDIWAFYIGGYRPAEKWLKDRKGRDLSFDDVDCYCKICAVLTETIQIMASIDKIIDDNCGWPLK